MGFGNLIFPIHMASMIWKSHGGLEWFRDQGSYALTKAYELTGKIRYIDSAKKALMSFFVDVKDGGVTYKDKNDEWWFEEYAGSKKDEPRVFNGAIYALLDIFYYWEITNDKDANVLIEKGLNSIKRNIEKI